MRPDSSRAKPGALGAAGFDVPVDESLNCVLPVPDSWFRISLSWRMVHRKRRVHKSSTREENFVKIEIEYCGQ